MEICEINQTTPTKISSAMPDIENVYGNNDIGIALDIEGNLWGWGRNDNGQVGNGESGSGETQNSPVQITGANSPTGSSIIVKFTKVYEDENTNIALDEHGNLWGWGFNSSGQVGNGDLGTNQTTPVQITNWVGHYIDTSTISNVTDTSVEVTYTWNSIEKHTLQYQVLDEELNIIIPWIDLPSNAQPNGVDTEYTFTIEGLSEEKSYNVEIRNENLDSEIISISFNTTSSNTPNNSDQMSVGAIVGIIIGIVVGIGLLGGGIWFGIKRYN